MRRSVQWTARGPRVSGGKVPRDFRHELSMQRCSERASERLGWLSADGLITAVLPTFCAVGRGGQAGGLGASGQHALQQQGGCL